MRHLRDGEQFVVKKLQMDDELKQKKIFISIISSCGAAFFGLQCFAEDLHDTNILLRIDNTTAISYINRMGGIQFKNLNDITRQIWEWCESRNLWIFASYISSKKNQKLMRNRENSNRKLNFNYRKLPLIR